MYFGISPLTRYRLLVFVCALLTSLLPVTLPALTPFNASLRDGAREVTLKPPNYRLQTVIIDAGHGGKDPGGMGANSQEKYIALSIAQYLADQIRTSYPEIRVIMTRSDDTFIPLYERAAIANRNKADLFISIHANIMPGSRATYGTETFVMGQHVAEHNLRVAKRENAAILLEADYESNYDYDPNTDEGHILMSMYQSAFLEQSILFAELVEEHFATTAQRKSRGVKQAGFVVLKETAMPSVLIETGFMSNPREEAYLLSDGGRRELANAIFRAFVAYRGLVEAEDTTTPPAASVELKPVSSLSTNRLRQDLLHKEEVPTLAEREVTAPPAYVTETVPPPPITSTPVTEISTPPNPYGNPTSSDFRPKTINLPNRGSDGVKTAVLDREIDRRPVSDRPATYAPPTATVVKAPAPRASVLEREVSPPRNPAANPDNAVIPAVYQSDPASPVSTYRPVTPGPASATVIPSGEAIGEGSLVFAVQLAAATREIPRTEARWQELGYPLSVVRENGMYKYQARGMAGVEAAKSARQRLRDSGFTGAFIVVYRKDEKLAPEETRRILME